MACGIRCTVLLNLFLMATVTIQGTKHPWKGSDKLLMWYFVFFFKKKSAIHDYWSSRHAFPPMWAPLLFRRTFLRLFRIFCNNVLNSPSRVPEESNHFGHRTTRAMAFSSTSHLDVANFTILRLSLFTRCLRRSITPITNFDCLMIW